MKKRSKDACKGGKTVEVVEEAKHIGNSDEIRATIMALQWPWWVKRCT